MKRKQSNHVANQLHYVHFLLLLYFPPSLTLSLHHFFFLPLLSSFFTQAFFSSLRFFLVPELHSRFDSWFFPPQERKLDVCSFSPSLPLSLISFPLPSREKVLPTPSSYNFIYSHHLVNNHYLLLFFHSREKEEETERLLSQPSPYSPIQFRISTFIKKISSSLRFLSFSL